MTDPRNPRDPESERVLIAGLLIDAEGAIAALASDGVTIAPADCWNPQHVQMLGAILDMHVRGDAVGQLELRDELVSRGVGDSDAMLALVVDVASAAITSTGVVHAALRIVDCALRRRARAELHAAAEHIADLTREPRDTLNAHAERLEALRAGRRDRRTARVLELAELCDLPPAQWIVRGLVPASSVGFLVGPPNCGKSLIAVDIAMRCTRGETWIDGRGIRAGSVVYCLGEGAAGFGQRIRAWESQHGGPAHRERFAVVRGLPALSCPAGISELCSIVDEHATAHGPVVLVVVDTLAVHWAESEDKSEHVGPCMRALADLAAEHTCGVLLIHHPRKPQAGARDDPWAASRGSGAWIGAADYSLSLTPGTGDVVTLAVSKMRDGDRGSSVALRILGVPLDVVDDEGHPITAPILVPTEAEPQADADAARSAADEDRVRRVVEALRDLGGSASGGDRIARKAGGKVGPMRDALATAVDRGVVVRFGTSSRPQYRLADVPAARAQGSVPPTRDEDEEDSPRPSSSHGTGDEQGRAGTRGRAREGATP